MNVRQHNKLVISFMIPVNHYSQLYEIKFFILLLLCSPDDKVTSKKILLENKHFRNVETLLLLRRRASPKQSPHCVNATTFLCVFLLFKLGEGRWSSIVAWPV